MLHPCPVSWLQGVPVTDEEIHRVVDYVGAQPEPAFDPGFHEAMTTSRWLGFAIIWIALVIFAVDAWRSSREGRRVQDELAVAEPD